MPCSSGALAHPRRSHGDDAPPVRPVPNRSPHTRAAMPVNPSCSFHPVESRTLQGSDRREQRIPIFRWPKRFHFSFRRCPSLSRALPYFMKHQRIEDRRLSQRGEGLGTITKTMIRQRAREIAAINGRSSHRALDSDLEQARRELEGEERLVPVPTVAECLPESKRWDPNPGSPGHKTLAVGPEDEEALESELVEEGVAEAEHEQQIEAVRESRRLEGSSF